MSTDWDLICLTCNNKHGFEDANNRDQEMLILIKHADSIAALAELVTDLDISLTFNYRYSINPRWFREHLGHQLMPINEYGRLYDQCLERVMCTHCADWDNCGLREGHEGPHQTVKQLKHQANLARVSRRDT